MIRLVRHAVAGASVLIVLSATAVGATERPDPDVAYPDDPRLQEAYSRGFDNGYDDGDRDGYRRGLGDGQTANVDSSDLRDDVDALEDEGGQDLGDEITPSTPTPTVTPTATSDPDYGSTTMPEPPQESGSGIPWWPLSFATVATAWFVLRRRREPEDDEA